MQNLGNIGKWLAHALVCALAIGLCCTIADFTDVPVACLSDVATAAFHWSCVVLALWCVMVVVCALNRWVNLGFMVIVMAVGCALAYYRTVWNYSLNPSMFDIIGDNKEESTMMTWLLYVWVIAGVIAGGLIAFFGKKLYEINYRHLNSYIVVLVAMAGLAFILKPEGRLYRPVTNRIPFNMVYVYKDYLENRFEVQTVRARTVTIEGIDEDSLLTVVVIGEALRADNLYWNGYHRNTTPRLCQRKKNGLVPFKKMWTDITYTNGSVPRILTRATDERPDLAYTERSFIDLFVQAELPSAVITNQDIEKQYAYFWGEADTLITVNNMKNFYNFEKWLDSNVIAAYDEQVDKMKAGGLIIVHCIGSHWWYKTHYPDTCEYYKPVINSRIVVNCDSMAMVNTYDNTIRYTDIVVDSLIRKLENRKAQLLFISDHGEALGENGMWLHASECAAMHRTASFVWLSTSLRESRPDWETFYRSFEDKFVKTDSIYYWTTKQIRYGNK